MRIPRVTVHRDVLAGMFSCVIFAFAALLAAQASQQEVLNNATIVKMVKAGVPEEVIVEMIRTRPGRYSLSPDNVIDLKKQGVPGAALTEMLNKDSTPAGPSAAAPSAAPPSFAEPTQQALPSPPTGIWRIEYGQDQMSGAARVYASRTYPLDDQSGVFRVEAVCQPKVFLNLGMSLSSGRKIVLKETAVDRQSSTGAGSTPVTTHENCVLMRLRIGDALVKDVTSDSCGAGNFASIGFRGQIGDIMNTAQGQKEMAGLGSVVPQGLSGLFGQFADMAMNMAAPIADSMESSLGVGRMNDVFAARSIRIELPLTDGSFPVLEIDPQEPSFQFFASDCGEPIVDPRRGYLGASVRTLTPDLARQSRMSVNRGVIVAQVLPAGPAERSGLRAGDVITAMDAKPFDSSDRFTIAILSYPPGATVNLDVIRDGRPAQIAVTLGQRPEVSSAQPAGQPPQRVGSAALGAANPVNATSMVGLPSVPSIISSTKETFPTTLPGLVERAASREGIDPHAFDKEMALIVNTVNVCAQITPQMAASVVQGAVEDLSRLGEQYKPCQAGVSPSDVGTWNKDTERGLVAAFRPVGPLPKWQYGLGFVVSVTLVGNNSPDVPIVYAKITHPR